MANAKDEIRHETQEEPQERDGSSKAQAAEDRGRGSHGAVTCSYGQDTARNKSETTGDPQQNGSEDKDWKATWQATEGTAQRANA